MSTKHATLRIVQYGLLAIPLAFAGLPIYIYVPEFYASSFAISLTEIGFILLLLRFFDAIQDPYIGQISDRYFQQRDKLIGVGAVLLVIGFWLLFHPQWLRPQWALIIGMLLCNLGFSIVMINYQALGGLWVSQPTDRSKITAWREGLGLVGLILAAITPSILGSDSQALVAFHWLSVLYIPLLLVGLAAFFYWRYHASLHLPPCQTQTNTNTNKNSNTNVGFKNVLLSSWNSQFYGIYALNLLANALPAVLFLFFVNDRIKAPEASGLFLMGYFLTGACAMPLWQHLASRFGKEKTWLLSMGLAVLTFIWAYQLAAGDVWPFAFICLLSGLALGADLALPPAIVADHMVNETQYEMASRHFSWMTFLSKFALALATGFSLPILDWLGYQPGQAFAYQSTVFLSLFYALVPCIIKVLAMFMLWRFIHKQSAIVSG